MNFPENKKTGELGEMDVARLFVSWSWTVGKDHIDTGYDLNVEPSISEFSGHRFLVQVKATKLSKRGKIVARVSKKRLRQYVKNPLPVFLVRVTPDGTFYWLHVQQWAKANMSRMTSDGDAGIAMSSDQTLGEQELFVAYLREVFKPDSQKAASVAELAQERSSYLSKIDPRLLVKTGLADGHESYELSATDEPVEFLFSGTPSDGAEGEQKLADAIKFGLPTTVEFDRLSFSGSTLFDEIGLTGPLRGSLTVGANKARPGAVTFRPGKSYSMLASPLPLTAELYHGQEGFSIVNEASDGLLALNIRGFHDRRLTFSMTLRSELLEQAPLREFHQLCLLGDWAHEVLKASAMTIELKFWSTGPSMKTTVSDIEGARPLLRLLFWLGRLHRVAAALDSDWVLRKDYVITDDDENDIHLAYWLLKGERREVGLGPVAVVDAADVREADGSYEYVLQTALVMQFDHKELGVIPIQAELSGYSYESSGHGKGQLVRSDGAKALMYFNENGPTDMRMMRTLRGGLDEE